MALAPDAYGLGIASEVGISWEIVWDKLGLESAKMNFDGLKSLAQSRKFWLSLVGFIGASAAFARGLIDAEQWVNSILALVGVLVTSIAIEDHGTNSAPQITIQNGNDAESDGEIPFG